MRRRFSRILLLGLILLVGPAAEAQRTVKPALHGRHWVAVSLSARPRGR